VKREECRQGRKHTKSPINYTTRIKGRRGILIKIEDASVVEERIANQTFRGGSLMDSTVTWKGFAFSTEKRHSERRKKKMGGGSDPRRKAHKGGGH